MSADTIANPNTITTSNFVGKYQCGIQAIIYGSIHGIGMRVYMCVCVCKCVCVCMRM